MCYIFNSQYRRRWKVLREKYTPYLLPQGHPTTQGTGQTNDFGHERLKRQVLLQDHPPQDCLHFRYTWTWGTRRKTRQWGRWSEEKRWVEGKQLQTERDGDEENKWRPHGEVGADWYSDSFLHAHQRCILWIFLTWPQSKVQSMSLEASKCIMKPITLFKHIH